MPTLNYPSLAGPNLTRMIHLLPSKDTSAPIECTLFNYDLSDGSGGVHIYEALSYCWESNIRSGLVVVNGCAFPVTKNLHTALLYLRDHQLARTLWVDAICINQDDVDEKSAQIPLMRSIFAQAGQVIVWLGEDRDGGDKALEGIQCIAAQNETTQSLTDFRDTSWKLLQRDWFRRIWVLQEVGVARSVSIMCGPVQISGRAFCEGLIRLGLPPSIQNQISPVIYLINGASFRPRREIAPQGALHIGELMSMYPKHYATVQHDRIYALLGLSSDAQSTALQPDYRLPWHDVLKNTLRYIFPECSIQTNSMGTAVIQGKAWILGHVHTATKGNPLFSGEYTITIVFSKVAQSLGYHEAWKDEWKIQPSANLVQEGDVICLFPGASTPNIVRVCNDHLTVILAAVMPYQLEGEKMNIMPDTEHDMTGLRDTLLTWSFALGDAELKPEEYRLSLIEKVPDFQEIPDETKFRANQIISVIWVVAVGTKKDQKKRSNSKALKQILDQSGIYAPIIEMFRVATQNSESYGNALIEVLTQKEGEGGLVSGEVLKAAAQYTEDYGPETMDFLLNYQGQSLPVSEEVVKAAAQNTGLYGSKIMNVLFKYQGQSLPVSEEVIKAAAQNTGGYGPEIMNFLLNYQGQSLPVSEEVVKAAAQNTGYLGWEIMNVLFKYQRHSLPVSEQVAHAAVANRGDSADKIVQFLLEQQCLVISEEALKIAANNSGHEAFGIMIRLLKGREQGFLISEEVLKAAATNLGSDAGDIMGLLLDELEHEQDQGYLIPKEVLKLGAANTGWCADGMMIEILRRLKPEQSHLVTQEVLKIAAANPEGGGFFTSLLKHVRNDVAVPEEVVMTAGENTAQDAYHIMGSILDHQLEGYLVSEEALKKAVGNTGKYGYRIIETILDKQRGLILTEEVVKEATKNANWEDMFGALFRRRGEDVPLTEDVIKAAAENIGEDESRMMEILCQKRQHVADRFR